MSELINKIQQVLDEKTNKILPENIKAGINIFNVSGKSSVVDTEDANATNIELAQGKSAYVNGNKIVGRLIQIPTKAEDILGYQVDNVYRATDNKYTNVIFAKDTDWDTEPCYTAPESEMRLYIAKDDLADAIGLRSDIILEGNTILNIVGTGKSSEDLQEELTRQESLINQIKQDLKYKSYSGENLADEMRLYDMAKKSLDAIYVVYSDRNYTDDEIAKVENLLNKLGGNING